MSTPSVAGRSLRVEVANLTEAEHLVFAAIVALFADPQLARMRAAFMTGRFWAGVDDGEPTWTALATAPRPWSQN